MKRIGCRIGIGVALLAFGAGTGAQALRGFERDFSRIDRDQDGSLSREEFESRVTEMFFFSDLDDDGELVPAEARPGIAQRFAEFDEDGNGRISAPEFMARHRLMLRSADTDGDGALSRAELDALPAGPDSAGQGRRRHRHRCPGCDADG